MTISLNSKTKRSTIYERIAVAGPLRCTSMLTSGVFPKITHIAQFIYYSGLIVNYDGDKWTVMREECGPNVSRLAVYNATHTIGA
jgi:hypothetical protein